MQIGRERQGVHTGENYETKINEWCLSKICWSQEFCAGCLIRQSCIHSVYSVSDIKMESCQWSGLRERECLNGSDVRCILQLNKAWQVTLLRPHFSLCQLNMSGSVSEIWKCEVVCRILLSFAQFLFNFLGKFAMVPACGLRWINLCLKRD